MSAAITTKCVHKSTAGGRCTLEMHGALDWRSAPDFRSATPNAGEATRLLVDLTDVDRMDSAGTGAVISTYLQTEAEHIDMAVLAEGSAEAFLDRVGLGLVIPLFSDRGRARAWIEG